MNRCDLCEQDKDEAMLLLQGAGNKRQACGTCVCGLVQGQAGLVQLAAVDEAMAIIALGILQAAARKERPWLQLPVPLSPRPDASPTSSACSSALCVPVAGSSTSPP